jgi:hypothetical protein
MQKLILITACKVCMRQRLIQFKAANVLQVRCENIAAPTMDHDVMFKLLPSNRIISSLEGKFGTVGETFVLVLEPLFMKISNLCINHL